LLIAIGTGAVLATNRLKKKNPVSAVCGADEKVQYMQKK